MGAFQGLGGGSGRPKGRSSILERPGAKISFKKTKFIFKNIVTGRASGRTLS